MPVVIVSKKPALTEAIFYDGTIDAFFEIDKWAHTKGGELYTANNYQPVLYIRNETTHLLPDYWVVLNDRGTFDVYDSESFKAKFDQYTT